MCVIVLPVYMYVYCVCAQFSYKSEEDVESPGNGITGGLEPLHGFWESNPGPLWEISAPQ